MTGQIIASLGSSSSWKHGVDTAASAVVSQSSSERLSSPYNGDLPITPGDWTVIDTNSNTGFLVAPTSRDMPASKQLQVSQAHPCDASPEMKNNLEMQADEVLFIDGVSSQSPNPLEWAEIVSDSAAGKVATLSPA